MCPDRSASPLSPLAAVALTLLGAAALVAGGTLLGPRLHLGLRAQIALGSLLLALPCVVALPLARPRTWRRVLGVEAPGMSPMVLSVLLGGALWVGSIGLMELQSLVLPPPPEYLDAFRAIHAALAPTDVVDALVSVTVIALLPGVGEELVTRGVLLPALAVPLGPATAIVVSAALFASIHLDPYRFAFTLVIGLVLGVVRLRTGSLWSPIVAHATLNTLTFLVAPLVDDPTQVTYTPQPVLGLACLLAGTALVVPLLRALGRSVDSPEPPA